MNVCPECDFDLEPEGVKVGDVICCPDCGADLMVVDMDPLTLTLVGLCDEDEEYFDDEECSDDDDEVDDD